MQGSYEKLHKKFLSQIATGGDLILSGGEFFVVANRPNTNLHIFLIQFL